MAKIFNYTDGNETITGYNGGDTIQIMAGKVDKYSFDGNDLIFTIGSGSLRLVDMKGRAITVKTSSGKKTTKIYGTGYTGQDVIKNLVKAWTKTQLTGIPKLDEAIKLCSHFKGVQDVIDHMVADCKSAGDGDTFLKKYCGIILENNDIGAITGWDAGGLKVKTTRNILPKKTPLEHLDDYTQASFVRNNVTINISSTGDSLTADGKKIFDGLYSWWAQGVLNLIEESYGVEFQAGNEINIALTPNASYWAHTSGNKDVTISLNYTHFKNDEDYQGNGVDRTIAHEFTHIAQALFMGSLPQFLKEGLADLTCGIDLRKTTVIKNVAGNADTLKKYLDLGKGGTGNPNYYAAGYMFYRYLAKQAADAYDSSSDYAWTANHLISGTSKADFLTSSGTNSTIMAGAGNDTLTAHGDSIKIFGEGGNDTILTNGEAIKVSGGAGRDKLKNLGDQSTLAGDAGNDTIINGGYWENERGGANVSISSGAGNDTIISHGSNSVLDGGINKDLIYNGYRYYEPTKYFYNANDDDFRGNGSTILGGTGNDTIYNIGDKVSIDAGTGRNFISNGNAYCIGGSRVIITSSTNNDTLTNYGGSRVKISADAGNDLIENIYAVNYRDYSQETKLYETIETIFPERVTLSGGKGNDTIINNGSKVLIKYTSGDGNDLIRGFNATSTLSIAGGTYSTTKSGENILVAVDDGKITLQGAASLSAVNIKGTKALTVTNKTKSPVTIDAATKVIDASTRTKAVKLTGNDLANSIFGGSKNDTLIGGKGNDSLWGNGGADTFIYTAGDGKDVIYGFDSKDTLTLDELDFTTSYSKSKGTITFKSDGGSVTLKNFTTSTFHINDDTYKISGSKLKKTT
ncbi:MAG: calcium-binding protein [Quinella sp. 1Q5]|nr:calcium-binding protein [Quinella sp. 1Q5]